MTARHYYRNQAGDVVEITANVRVAAFEVHDNAEEGSVGSGSVTVDDDAGTLTIGGHRRWMIVEDEVADPDDQVIWFGYTADKNISRGPSMLTEASRQWQVNLVGSDSVLSRRIMVGADAKRPAETDVARINWLIGTNEIGVIDDFRFVFDTQPVQMDACDYNGQFVHDIVDDCAQASGKNYWLDWFADVGQLGVWYGRAGLPDYEAAIAISNVLSEVDHLSIFEMSQDTKLNQSPDRVFSGVYLPFDGGNVYKQKPATESAFAHRDTSMPSANVKTAAKAARRATRYLNDLDTEEDRITTSIWVPPTHVNKVRKGQLLNFKATHLPGYETFTPMRVLSKGVTQLPGEMRYKIDLELSGGDTLPGVGNGGARLYFPMNRDNGVDSYPDVLYNHTGDDPGAGRSYYPLQGPLSYTVFEGDHTGGDVWSGITIDAAGTATIVISASIAGVVGGMVSVNLSILLNGSVIANTVFGPEDHSGGPGFIGPGMVTTAEDVEVAEGDTITTLMYFTGDSGGGGGKVPGGVGSPAEYLQVTGTFEGI